MSGWQRRVCAPPVQARHAKVGHPHPSLERVVRWLRPSAESFAAAAAVYSPDLLLHLETTSRERRHECRAR